MQVHTQARADPDAALAHFPRNCAHSTRLHLLIGINDYYPDSSSRVHTRFRIGECHGRHPPRDHVLARAAANRNQGNGGTASSLISLRLTMKPIPFLFFSHQELSYSQ